jgi:hypothetical protein
MPRASDGFLIVDGTSDTIADAYLSKGWKVMGIYPTGSNVTFILQQGGEGGQHLGFNAGGGFDQGGAFNR